MFRNWGFLLGEMWVLILLAALLGLLAGWLIWGRRSEVTVEGDVDNTAEMEQLRTDLAACRQDCASFESEVDRLNRDLSEVEKTQASAMPAPVAAHDAAIEQDTIAAAAESAVDYDGDGIIEGENEGAKPATLDGPRDGKADDLKKIKGVGPKMEQLCNKLGFYHFDQIAGWSTDEVAWVDANLEGFKGRVSRDNWVDQAKLLASGAETEFSKRVDKGSVY